MTFDECWAKAMSEIEEDKKSVSENVLEFTAADGKVKKIKFVADKDRTFITLTSLKNACGAYFLPTTLSKRGITLCKARTVATGRDCWIADAMNAVRIVARYGHKEPGFKQFFQEQIFPKLSDFWE